MLHFQHAGHSHISTPGVRAPPCYSPAASLSAGEILDQPIQGSALITPAGARDSLQESGTLEGDGRWERCCFLIARRPSPTKPNQTPPAQVLSSSQMEKKQRLETHQHKQALRCSQSPSAPPFGLSSCTFCLRR